LRPYLQPFLFGFCQRLQREFIFAVLEEFAQLKVVFRVEIRLYIDVILDELQELLLQLVYLMRQKEWVHKSKVYILDEVVVPDLLSYK